MDFEKIYQEAVEDMTGDMYKHLPIISKVVEDCKHITEFGLGKGESTKAFLRHDVEIHTYEIDPMPESVKFIEQAKAAGKNITLHIGDTRAVEIEETDLLFLDSYHSCDQVKKELELHAAKVRKYIMFHDTTLYGFVGQGYKPESDYYELGVWPAIQEFLDTHIQWQIVHHVEENNGFTVLQKKPEFNVKIVAHNLDAAKKVMNPMTGEYKDEY